jgi:phosphatidate cytidylyltransferase
LLRTRFILGIVIVAVLLGICWLDFHAARPGIFLLPLAVVLGVAGAGELLAMWQQRDGRTKPLSWIVYGGTIITILAAGSPIWMPPRWSGSSTVGDLGWVAIGLVASLLLAMIGEMWRYERPGSATSNLAFTCLAVIYVGGLMGFMVQLRLLGADAPGRTALYGMLALLSLITIVKLSDIGQYTAGRIFGAHKLAPTISPGKTWEGVLGGMIFAIGGGIATVWVARAMGVDATVRFNFTLFVYCVSVAALGIVGDLAESLLKRDAGVKDSSTWLPGFGGVLDILDSLLGAAPIAYFFWAVIF